MKKTQIPFRKVASFSEMFLDYIEGKEALREFFAHPAIADVKKIGTGHSMGGMMITLINALMPFDAICLIGSNAGGLDWGLQEEDMKYIEQPERLEKEIEVVNELTDANGLDLNERPTFYDMEVQIDDMVNNSMAECAEQMVEDNMANVLDRLDKLENFFGRKEDK